MKQHRKGSLQLILVGVIIIVAVLYLVFVKPYYYQFNGGEVFFETLYVENYYDHTDYDMYVYNRNIYISSKNGLKKIDSEGVHLWDQSYYLENPVLKSAEGYMCVADINGKDIYLFTEEGLVTHINTNYEILLVKVNEVGAVSVFVEYEGVYRVEIYNRLGNLAAVSEVVVEQYGYPIAYDLSPNGEILSVNHIVIDKSQLSSNLRFHGFGDERRKDPDYLIGSELLIDTWIGELAFIDEVHMIGISDENLYFYEVDLGSKLLQTIAYSGNITDYGIVGNMVILTLSDPLTGEDRVQIYNEKGKLMSDQVQETNLRGLCLTQENYFLVKDYKIEKYQDDKAIWFNANTRGAMGIYNLYKEYYVIQYLSSYEIVRMKDL